MFTEEESKFIAWWEGNRDTQRKSFKHFLSGFSKGLVISMAIVIVVASGWYTRANMEANSKLSTIVFVIALLGIAVFMAWLSQNYKWEQNEQQYLELMAKKKRKEAKALDSQSKENIIN